jgi:uncharacterized damage-inducible protein DinB
MSPARSRPPVDPAGATLLAFATSDRINAFLIERLDDTLWAAKPVAGRSVRAIVAHMHNVRRMWLAAVVKGARRPTELDRDRCTRDQALTALAASRDALLAVMRAAFAADGRVKEFRPDAAGFAGYLIAHDAHHRGQICQLARQLGHRLDDATTFGLWDWAKRAQEAAEILK